MPGIAVSARAMSDGSIAPSRVGLGVIAVLASMALVVTDAAMVGVALPTIAAELNVNAGAAVWIVSVYQLALLMFLLPAAAAAEAYGHRRIFSAGLLTFITAAMFSAQAPSLPWLLAARFLQGVGGAAIMALGVALLRQAVPQARFGAAIGWNALTVALCSAAAPAIAAFLLSAGSWHWLFLVHLPLGAIALLSSRALLPGIETGGPLDIVSMTLPMAGFALLLLGLADIAAEPARASLMIGAGAGLFWIVVRRERGKSSPVIPVDLLRIPSFRLSVGASITCFTAQTAGLLALPFYFHQAFGSTPFETGLLMTPWPVSVGIAAVISARIADRHPSVPLTVAGAALLGLGLGVAALTPSGASPATLALCSIACGLGFGLFQVPNNRNLFMAVAPARSGAAGGLQGTARLVGQAFGAIVVGLALASATAGSGPALALGIGSTFAFAAAVLSARRALVANIQKIEFDSIP